MRGRHKGGEGERGVEQVSEAERSTVNSTIKHSNACNITKTLQVLYEVKHKTVLETNVMHQCLGLCSPLCIQHNFSVLFRVLILMKRADYSITSHACIAFPCFLCRDPHCMPVSACNTRMI